jgi:predicted lysophospholipase L1 biosynthesis ABC-type transport system permease subunit
MRNTIKPGNLSILISFGFIVSFTSLLFISILSLNFLARLDIDLSNDNNVYIVNIPDEDIEKIDEQYTDNAFSIILARITSINSVLLADHVGARQMSGRFSREFNITDNALSDVELLEGSAITQGEVSVDDDFAQSL